MRRADNVWDTLPSDELCTLIGLSITARLVFLDRPRITFKLSAEQLTHHLIISCIDLDPVALEFSLLL